MWSCDEDFVIGSDPLFYYGVAKPGSLSCYVIISRQFSPKQLVTLLNFNFLQIIQSKIQGKQRFTKNIFRKFMKFYLGLKNDESL